MTTREALALLARQARLFVDCANQPAAGEDTSGCTLIHDDSHFAQLEAALDQELRIRAQLGAEAHLRRGDAPS